MTAFEQNDLRRKDQHYSVWLHRLTILMVCLVWPLIWVGGLVTTYDAGMSVPDWPGTYGDNLFLYPYTTWLYGPFDLFIEHGHRLLGALVGMVAIAIMVLSWACQSRVWFRWLAVAILLMVIVQGCLGGIRVVAADRSLAMVHGCFGQLFFAVCAASAVATNRRWFGDHPATRAASADNDTDRTPPPNRLVMFSSGILIFVCYLQIVFGAMIRHVQPTMSPGSFAAVVAMHVMTAFLLWALTGWVWLAQRKCGDLTLSRPAGFLVGLSTVQIVLGVGTWAARYGWPTVLRAAPWADAYLVHAKGFVDSMVVTAHVATGAAILAVATVFLVRTMRQRWLSKYHSLTIGPTTG